MALCLLACFGRPAMAQQGTWTTTNASGASLETALLLTDGTVIAHTYGNYAAWFKLTPDAYGNYAGGTWTRIASNAVGRLYGQTAVLRDGRVFYGGGEYLTGTTDHNSCEVYDPIADQWTPAPDSLYDSLGDTGAAILADGRLLCSNWNNSNTDIYDPVSNSWSNAAPMASDTGDEETWNTLSDGSVLSTFHIGQRYIPSQNVWLPTAAIPVSLVDAASEIGPGLQLYDGRVFVLGATGHTAFYTLPQTLTDAGSWAAGPDMPNGLGASDAPACVEVNGKVLCLGSPTDFAAGTMLEFDPATNAFSTVSLPPGLASVDFSARMLALPNGQVLLTKNASTAWVYTPVSGPQPGWAPAVSSVTANGGIYTVSGTQLNGLTNGSSYGDEANPYTHYPIVYLVDGVGIVRFARTSNFSQMSPSAPGGHQTADFTPPAGANGTYSLYVSASGISSAAFSVQIGPNAAIPPTSLTAVSSFSKVVLNWQISGGAGATYNVYRGTMPGGESANPIATGVTPTTYTDSDIVNGTTYYYKVTMVVGTSVSGPSNEASATATSGPPVLLVPTAAYPTIQSAINAALSGYVVQVADGTYTGRGNVDLDFGGKKITVQSQHGPAATIIECGGTVAVAHRGFLFHTGETSASVVSGFTIQNANGKDEGACRVESGSAATIQNCVFLNNTSNGSGAGMFVNGAATVTNCTFTGNVTSGGYQSGAGIFTNGSLLLRNCTFTGNHAGNYGAGIDVNSGAATLTNCIFSSNTASDAATALNFGTLVMTNCTSTQNTSGSLAVYNGGTETLTNDILFNDSSAEAGGITAVITYCDIQGGSAGTGNINADPLFVGGPADLHLKPGSPCLQAGTGSAAPATDLDGTARPNPPSIGAYDLVELASLIVPSPVPGGTVVTATVRLDGPALADMVIGLSSSDSSIVRLHRAVIIPAGSSSATFPINTFRSHVTKTVTIQATEGALVLTAPLVITGR